jgi:hypothetical protein
MKLIAAIVFMLLALIPSIAAQSGRDSVRYVIAFSDIERHDQEMRSVSVLIKPESFSESVIADLVTRIGRRFEKPTLLYINIYSNLDDVETPEEHDRAGSSETPEMAMKQRAKPRNNSAYCVRLETSSFGNCHMILSDGTIRDIRFPR